MQTIEHPLDPTDCINGHTQNGYKNESWIWEQTNVYNMTK